FQTEAIMHQVPVHQCEATECSFNDHKACHALAITVGPPNQAECDTFTHQREHGGNLATVANVGACKAADCKYNEHLICQAPQIDVGFRNNQIACMTYQKMPRT